MAAKYIALIPAYRPDRKLTEVVSGLGASGMDVVIVDDGSGPEYSEIFEQAYECLSGRTGRRTVLLIHDINRGKGAALKTGLDHIYNFMAEDAVIVTVDADGQHLAADALRTAKAAAEKPGTLVLGSRSFGRKRAEETSISEGIPLRSMLGNTITRGVFRLATGVYAGDTQTGLRAFTADMIPSLLGIRGDRYEYEMNMLLELAGNGIEIREIPVETVYLDGNSSSHFDTVRDSWKIYKNIAKYIVSKWSGSLRQMIRFSASSFASFLIDYALYAILLAAGAGLAASNIGARVISASANFAMNRRLVFNSEKSLLRSALQYAALAAVILTGNTIVLSTLAGAGMGKMIAKVITEITFFMISWLVQRYVVFYRESDAKQTGSDEQNADREAQNRSRNFVLSYTPVRPKKLREAYRKDLG